MLSCRPFPTRLGSFHVHDPVYPRFLRDNLIPSAFRDRLRVVCAPTIPDAPYVIPGDDLDESASLHVTDFYESAVEEEDIGRVPGNPLRGAFPLNCAHATTWVPVFVNVQSELYEDRQLFMLLCTSGHNVPS